MFTTQFHVKEQGAAKPIHGRRRRQDESVSKKVLDIDRRFIDVFSVSLWLTNSKQKHTTETQRTQRLHREEGLLTCCAKPHRISEAARSSPERNPRKRSQQSPPLRRGV